MNPDNGEIYRFDSQQSLAEKQAEMQNKLIELSKEQAEVLEHFPAHQRVQMHHDLISKNHAAKRRARKKIAKASRQRNRK